MNDTPDCVCNTVLSRSSLRNCTCGAISEPNAAVAMRQPPPSELDVCVGWTDCSIARGLKKNVFTIKKGDMDSRQRHIYLNEKGKKLFDEIFLYQKKRIYNALKDSDSDSVIKFKNVLNKIINE